MAHRHEVAVITEFVAWLTTDLGDTHPMTLEQRRFYALRTLELYYRALPVVGGSEATVRRRDMLVCACLDIVFKQYHSPPHFTIEELHDDFGTFTVVDTLVEFKNEMLELQAGVLKHVGWSLVPSGMIREGDDLRFHESWEFGASTWGGPESRSVLVRPSDFAGPYTDEISRLVARREKCVAAVMAVQRLGTLWDCPDILMGPADAVKPLVRSVFEAVVRRVKVDSVFAHSVKSFCIVRYKGKTPDYVEDRDLAAVGVSREVVRGINEEMMREPAEMLARKSEEMERAMLQARVKLQMSPLGLKQEERKAVMDRIQQVSKIQSACMIATRAIRVISKEGAEACLEASQRVDLLIIEVVDMLKATTARGAPQPAAEPSVVVKKTVDRRMLMCTRVSTDPFKTPATGVLHRVKVVPAAVHFSTVTYAKSDGGARLKPIKVEVKPNFFKACEAQAASYEARSAAADAAFEAAHASEQEAMASAAEASEAAAAADEAANAAADAALAAAEAEAAAALAAAELHEEI